PKTPAPEAPVAKTQKIRVAIVGAGAAGLAAARELDTQGIAYELIERERGTTAVGLYEDAEGWFLAVVKASSSLTKLYAERFLLAPGGQAALVPFKNNDLPGVISSRAASVLLSRDRVLPGQDVVFVGHGEELKPLMKQFQDAGARIAAVFPADMELKAHGFGWVRRVSYKGERVRCDLVVVGAPPAPRFELARQAGARVSFSRTAEAFVVEADAEGRTENPKIYVAGDVTGQGTDAAAAGARAVQALVRSLA
ncbi:MAG: FAD-dependent monooxygenase, partial [Myxococcaceae bacterium]